MMLNVMSPTYYFNLTDGVDNSGLPASSVDAEPLSVAPDAEEEGGVCLVPSGLSGFNS